MSTGNTIHDFVEIKESRLLLKYSIPLENPANNILKAVLKPIAQGKRKFKKNTAVYRKWENDPLFPTRDPHSAF